MLASIESDLIEFVQRNLLSWEDIATYANERIEEVTFLWHS